MSPLLHDLIRWASGGLFTLLGVSLGAGLARVGARSDRKARRKDEADRELQVAVLTVQAGVRHLEDHHREVVRLEAEVADQVARLDAIAREQGALVTTRTPSAEQVQAAQRIGIELDEWSSRAARTREELDRQSVKLDELLEETLLAVEKADLLCRPGPLRDKLLSLPKREGTGEQRADALRQYHRELSAVARKYFAQR